MFLGVFDVITHKGWVGVYCFFLCGTHKGWLGGYYCFVSLWNS
jgi:hypothetical protein